jgi:hypothetical protein
MLLLQLSYVANLGLHVNPVNWVFTRCRSQAFSGNVTTSFRNEFERVELPALVRLAEPRSGPRVL